VVNHFKNAELEFIEMNNQFDGYLDASLHSVFTKEVLYKLLAPSLFPNHDKLIITDVDVIFLSDISKSYFCFESTDIEKRRQIALQYRRELANVPGITI